jgi:drug/metabolite transporter (DMT)-like permease
LALIGSGLPFFLNLWLLKHVAAWVIGLSSLIIPVIAVAVGVLFGGEQFGPRELLGAALVLIGVWVSLTGASPSTR